MNIQEENKKQLKTMVQNFKLLRKERNWSIEELSQISKIDNKILMNIENGKDFDLDFLFTLCEIYGIKVYQIFLPLEKK